MSAVLQKPPLRRLKHDVREFLQQVYCTACTVKHSTQEPETKAAMELLLQAQAIISQKIAAIESVPEVQ